MATIAKRRSSTNVALCFYSSVGNEVAKPAAFISVSINVSGPEVALANLVVGDPGIWVSTFTGQFIRGLPCRMRHIAAVHTEIVFEDVAL